MASLKIVLGNTIVFFISEHDECATNQHNCDENALCFNTVGGHNCVCKPGYAGNGTICKGRERLWPLLDIARRATISLLLSSASPFCASWTLSRLSTPECWYMARHLHLCSISAPSPLLPPSLVTAAVMEPRNLAVFQSSVTATPICIAVFHYKLHPQQHPQRFVCL